ncbi:MAG TPA: 16S rRNA (guanine(527)-N(7))-methyltransferase RsmG [Acidobacteriaceae bacterium]|nr:16S rRNA (guanine(527)-N(7))-methyltransferase RsmG [Acidobacteriaceae bacterium]
MNQRDEHQSALKALGLDSPSVAQLETFLALLLRWNARINLTAVRQPEEIIRRHFAESIFAAQQIPNRTKTLLDYGSGGGFPGIPIAIRRPDIAVTLAESQNKKAAFLREAVRTLGLKAEVWADRVEAMEPGRVFDGITLRAVDKMPAACRIAAERLAPRGWIAVFTTRRTEGALEEIPGVCWDAALEIPGSEQEILKTGHRSPE